MGVKNTLLDLNDHLFMEIERLGDEDLSPDEIKAEVDRAKAIAGIADKVIRVGDLVLEATKYNNDFETDLKAPRMLIGDGK